MDSELKPTLTDAVTVHSIPDERSKLKHITALPSPVAEKHVRLDVSDIRHGGSRIILDLPEADALILAQAILKYCPGKFFVGQHVTATPTKTDHFFAFEGEIVQIGIEYKDGKNRVYHRVMDDFGDIFDLPAEQLQ